MKDHRHDATGVQARFGRAAATYDDVALIQAEAVRRLIGQMDGLSSPARILDAGCGSGLLTRALAAKFPHAHIVAMDISQHMLDAARFLHVGQARVGWVHGNIVHLESEAPFDLIASASALHWTDDLPAALARCADHLTHDGRLAVSIMLDGTLQELHASRAAAAPGSNPPARMPSLPELEAAARAAKLDVIRAGEYALTATYPDARRVLKDLHAMGLTGGARLRPPRLLTRSELDRLCQGYEQRFRALDGTVPATYRIGWLIARPDRG